MENFISVSSVKVTEIRQVEKLPYIEIYWEI